MSKYKEHFKMNENQAIEYIKTKLESFNEDDEIECSEIGDGNINYIFRLKNAKTGESVILKQADKIARSSGSEISIDRNRIEAEILQLHGKLAPGMAPKVYFIDPIMSCLCMEDLFDYEIMRDAIVEYKTFDKFADQISDFLVNTLLFTTDLVLDPFHKKDMVKSYINPYLCDISERLVYTDPYTNHSGNNKILEGNEAFVEEEVYNDKKLLLEVAKLKNEFKNNAQALIHGDLHSGSIFINKNAIKVIDPEFAFYGPIGYDVGNVVGNLFFTWARAYVELEEGEKKDRFILWISESISNIIDQFQDKFKKAFKKEVIDVMGQQEGFDDWYLGQILSDTAGVAGLEINRRVIGTAKVADITTITSKENRKIAERILILVGKDLIINRKDYLSGRDYIDTMDKVISQFK